MSLWGNLSIVGDPVNVTTGNVISSRVDLQIPGPGLSVRWERTYNSQLAHLPGATAGVLGFGWTHPYNSRLAIGSNGIVTVHQPSGAAYAFTSNYDGIFNTPHSSADKLVANSGGTYSLHRPDGVIWNYSATGQLTSIADPNGNTITLSYTSGRLSKITDTAGREIDLTYDGSGRISTLTDELARTITYTYETDGDLDTFTNQEGAVWSYDYDSNHNLTQITYPGDVNHPSGVTTFTYDTQQRAIEVNSDGAYQDVELDYDPAQQRTTVTNSRGHDTVYHYDEWGQVIKLVDPDNHERLIAWDANGYRSSVTDENGHTTNFDYDDQGRLLEVKRPAPQSGDPRPTMSFTYGDFGRMTSMTDANNRVTEYDYDTKGNLLTITLPKADPSDPTHPTTQFTVNAAGQPLTVTDANNNTTTYTYDAEGNVDAITNARSKTTSFDHDAVGRLTQITDPLTRVTDMDYDDADRLEATTLPPANPSDPRPTIEREYDPRGNLIELTDANGHATTYSYDRNDQLLSITDATNRTTNFDYDSEGNRTSVTDSAGVQTDYEYDKRQRLVKTIQDDGTTAKVVTELQRDPAGRLTALIDPRGHDTAYGYDDADRLTSVTDANGDQTLYEYSPTDRLTSTTNGNGHETTFAYDGLDRLKTKTNALSRSWIYGYDGVGNLTSETKPAGEVITRDYTATNQLEAIAYSDATPDVSLGYDDVGNLTSSSDGTGTTSYAYDGRNRLVSETLPGTRVLSYGYDAVGNRTQLVLPGWSAAQTFAYDDANRLLSTTDPHSRTTSYDYDMAGRVEEIDLPRAGAGRVLNYDPMGRVTQLTATAGSGQLVKQLDYDYDKASNITDITDENADVSSFSYDDANQLLVESHQGPGATTRTYTYDDAGNRASLTTGGTTRSYTYDDAEQMLTAGAVTFTYDDNGQLVQRVDGSTTTDYDWDAAGRMIEEEGVQFSYDWLDRRVGQTDGSTSKSFVFDGQQVVQQTIGASTTDFIRGLDQQLISMQTGASTPSYYHHDALGSVLTLSNGSTGSVLDEYAYNAFGDTRALSASTANTFGALGNVTHDPSVLSDDYHARPYDPSNGRFLARDPIAGVMEIPGTQNPYAYGLNNPFVTPDPLGLMSIGGMFESLNPLPHLSNAADTVIETSGDIAQYLADHAQETLAVGAAIVCVASAVPTFGVSTTVCFIAGGSLFAWGTYENVQEYQRTGDASSFIGHQTIDTLLFGGGTLFGGIAQALATLGPKGAAALAMKFETPSLLHTFLVSPNYSSKQK